MNRSRMLSSLRQLLRADRVANHEQKNLRSILDAKPTRRQVLKGIGAAALLAKAAKAGPVPATKKARIAIVGGGIAGLNAALTLQDAGLSSSIYEASPIVGGASTPTPPLKKTAIQELGYGTNSKLALQSTERLWDPHGPWGLGDGNMYTDLFFQNTWDSARGIPGKQAVLVAFMGGSSGLRLGGASSPFADSRSSPQRAGVPPRGEEAVARHREFVERPRDALDAVARAQPARQLLVLDARPIYEVRRLRGPAAGQLPLRGRTLLAGLPGVHGGRCHRGRAGGAGDHRRSQIVAEGELLRAPG
jgi:hypothetical protein